MCPLLQDNVMIVVWFLHHAKVKTSQRRSWSLNVADQYDGVINTHTHMHTDIGHGLTSWPTDHGVRCLFVDSLNTWVHPSSVSQWRLKVCLCVAVWLYNVTAAEWCCVLALRWNKPAEVGGQGACKNFSQRTVTFQEKYDWRRNQGSRTKSIMSGQLMFFMPITDVVIKGGNGSEVQSHALVLYVSHLSQGKKFN